MYEVNQTFKGKTGEAFRVVSVDEKQIHLSVFESDFVMGGDIDKFEKLGVVPIDEKEYKTRVCAMIIFQNERKNESKYEDYLIFYDQIKDEPQGFIDEMFNLNGGYRDYERPSAN